MSAIRLVLRGEPDQRLDLSVVTPDRIATLDPAAIARLPVQTTRRPATLGDWFTVQPGEPDHLVIEGGSARLDGVGSAMAEGRLEVIGQVGQHAGRGMRGGHLVVRGQVGDFAASGLRGGLVEIQGNAGNGLGAPLAGEIAGMRGGVVRVVGGVGARAGARLRRGLMIVEGDAGTQAGCGMVAGTLIICGMAGGPPGILMRRGTIILGSKVETAPSFVATAHGDLVMTQLLAHAARHYSETAANAVLAAVRRYAGDITALGKGEIFMPA